MYKSLLLSTLMAMGFLSLDAAIYYVDPVNGNASYNGFSPTVNAPSGPKQTIKQALDLSVSGDTVFLLNGVYAGNGNRNLRLITDGVSLIGNDRDSVVIDPAGASSFMMLGGDTLNFLENFRMENLTIKGGTIGNFPNNMIALYVRNSVIDRVKFLGNGNTDPQNLSGLKVFGTENMLLSNLELRNQGRYGIETGKNVNLTLRDIVFDSIGDTRFDAAIQCWTGPGVTFPGGATTNFQLQGVISFGHCVNGILAETNADTIRSFHGANAAFRTSTLSGALFGYIGVTDPFENTSLFDSLPVAYKLRAGANVLGAGYYPLVQSAISFGNDPQVVDSSIIQEVVNGVPGSKYHVGIDMSAGKPFEFAPSEVFLHAGNYQNDLIAVTQPVVIHALVSGLTVGSIGVNANTTLDGELKVRSVLNLNNGILAYQNASSLITAMDSAAVTGGSASSYIDGPLKIEASFAPKTFRFPVGKSGRFALAEVQVNQSAGGYSIEGSWEAVQAPVFTLPVTLREVKPYPGYWRLQYGPGGSFSNATATLYYLPQDSVTDPTELRVAGSSNGSSWKDFGGTGSAAGTGSIATTVNVTSADLGIFTLANSLTGTNFGSTPPVGIHTIETEDALEVFPNPVAVQERLYFTRSFENAGIRMVDVTGRTIQSWNAFQGNALELPAVSKGVYGIQWKENGQSGSKLILVE